MKFPPVESNFRFMSNKLGSEYIDKSFVLVRIAYKYWHEYIGPLFHSYFF